MCVHDLKQAKRKISIVTKFNKNRRIWIKKICLCYNPSHVHNITALRTTLREKLYCRSLGFFHGEDFKILSVYWKEISFV